MQANENYCLTLYAYAQYTERERIEGLIEYGHRLDLAGWMSAAYHEPRKLRLAAVRYENLIDPVAPGEVDEIRATALAMHARLVKAGVVKPGEP